MLVLRGVQEHPRLPERSAALAAIEQPRGAEALDASQARERGERPSRALVRSGLGKGLAAVDD